MKITINGLEKIVEEQLTKWNRLQAQQKRQDVKLCPVITISREPGTGGTTIAEKLAQALTMDFMSGKIIEQVAQNAQMSEQVVRTLDEKDVSLREDWLKIIFDSRHLWPDIFIRHLMRVISTIGRHGNAVILGRGANYFLPLEETFRVRLIAPREARIAKVMADRDVSREEAEKYVVRTESDREAFVRKYFQAEIGDPAHYDLVIDTSRLGIDGTVEVIRHAYTVWTGR